MYDPGLPFLVVIKLWEFQCISFFRPQKISAEQFILPLPVGMASMNCGYLC